MATEPGRHRKGMRGDGDRFKPEIERQLAVAPLTQDVADMVCDYQQMHMPRFLHPLLSVRLFLCLVFLLLPLRILLSAVFLLCCLIVFFCTTNCVWTVCAPKMGTAFYLSSKQRELRFCFESVFRLHMQQTKGKSDPKKKRRETHQVLLALSSVSFLFVGARAVRWQRKGVRAF